MQLNKSALLGAFLFAGSMMAAPICPTTTANNAGADPTGCAILITMTGANAGTVAATGTGTYDGVEDVTVGIINNSGGPLASLTLTSTGGGAFGFDNDGIQTFGSVNGVVIGSGGATGYEGPDNTFNTAGVVGGNGTLIINFNTPLALGASDYFSLEGTPSVSGGIHVGNAPEPGSIALLGSGLLALGGLVLRRRRAS